MTLREPLRMQRTARPSHDAFKHSLRAIFISDACPECSTLKTLSQLFYRTYVCEISSRMIAARLWRLCHSLVSDPNVEAIE